MKKYILLVIILCVGLISCEREIVSPPHEDPLCGFRFVIVDKEGNNILANDIEELGDFTVEFDGWVFNMKDDTPISIYVGRKEEGGNYRLTIYSDIFPFDSKIKAARFCWEAWWGDYQTFTIKYCDYEWNVVCDAIDANAPIRNVYNCDAVWIDDVESEPVNIGTTSKGEPFLAYELRMK